MSRADQGITYAENINLEAGHDLQKLILSIKAITNIMRVIIRRYFYFIMRVIINFLNIDLSVVQVNSISTNQNILAIKLNTLLMYEKH